MKKREWLSIIILAMVTVVSLLIGIGQLYVTGVDGDRLWEPESLWLLFETATLFGVFFLIFRRTKTWRLRSILLFLVIFVFTWIHQVFLPMVVSGLYFLFILKTGSLLRVLFDRDRYFVEYHDVTAMADFVLGSGLVILLCCLMSLFGIGSIVHTRIAVMVLAAVFIIPLLASSTLRLYMKPKMLRYVMGTPGPMSWTAAVLISLILAMIFLQAGRMNIAVDYDSLHYGLRSEYILNNQHGIYENLGSINVVYTYAKGLEILLLPLSGLPSYGFFLCFQLWVTAAVLITAGRIAGQFVSRGYSVLCMALLSCIPGIMNMGITAKTDSITVLYQLILLYFLLLYLKKRRSCYLTLSLNAYFLTLVMKPTALVFSTVLLGTALAYMLITKQLRFRWKGSWWFSLVPTVLMWGLVWMRTLILTGIPVTSVFYQIWEKMGFYGKYPFWFMELPSNGGPLFSREGVLHFLKRLYGVLLAPVGEDMDHVRIAWGTSFLLVFLAMFLLPLLVEMRRLRKREKHPLQCLVAVFVTTGGASLAALYLLWQVDGNYFMLLYCLFAVLAVVVIGKLKRTFLARSIVEMMVPLALFNITVTAVSNWAGTLGMSPITVVHAGYFDHKAKNKEMLESQGNRRIWDILAEDPKTRVLTFGEQPEMLLFPCNAQSYTDIEGSDGNHYIAASPEALVCYFAYAKIDYIYVGSGYLKPGTDGWNNVVTMLEKGYMTDLIYENGNALGRFEPEPARPKDPEGVLEEFALKYWPGEQQ